MTLGPVDDAYGLQRLPEEALLAEQSDTQGTLNKNLFTGQNLTPLGWLSEPSKKNSDPNQMFCA